MCNIVKVVQTMMNQTGITHHLKLYFILALVYSQVTVGLKYYYGDGSYFIGEVDEHGRPSGHGKFHNTSGALEYDGEFSEGHPHGYGTWYGEDGTVFKGQFRYGRSSGKAISLKPNGDKIEGDFLNLRPHGSIVFTKAIFGDEKDLPLNENNERKSEYTNIDGRGNEKENTSQFEKKNLPLDSVIRNTGKIIRIEGEFRNGMAQGNLKLWYRSSADGKLIRIDGAFRMGQPHGYFRFVNEDDSILTEAKYLNGVPLENVHGRSNLKSKPYLFMIPSKVVFN